MEKVLKTTLTVFRDEYNDQLLSIVNDVFRDDSKFYNSELFDQFLLYSIPELLDSIK